MSSVAISCRLERHGRELEKLPGSNELSGFRIDLSDGKCQAGRRGSTRSASGSPVRLASGTIGRVMLGWRVVVQKLYLRGERLWRFD
jgi:hypothetical protein